MDTIDISNLNRQFLFRKEHVGKSKVEVATEAIKKIRTDINIKYFHDSVLRFFYFLSKKLKFIFSEKFGVSFFQEFSIVLSALDNKGKLLAFCFYN